MAGVLNLKALLKGRRGKRRRIVLPVIKPALADIRELEAIGRAMLATVYGFAPMLLKAIEPPAPAPGFTDSTDDLDRIMRLMVTQTQLAMTRLELRIVQWAARVDERHRTKFAEGILAASTINASTMLDPDDADRTVGAAVTWAVDLIRDLGDEARKRMASIVIAGVQQRIPPRELAKQIRASEDMSRRRAINIAADQANKLNSALDEARQIEAGIDHFIWRHSGKVHARPHHKARNGRLFKQRDPRIKPGDFPGQPPFCGCFRQAALIDETGAVIEGLQ